MATNGGRIDYTIGFKTDNTGLKEAQSALQELKTNFTPTDLFNMNPGKFKDIKSEATKALNGIKSDIESVQTAFSQAFDTTTGQMNLTKLNNSLKQLDINKIHSSFSQLGKQGEQAFYKMTKAALSTNTQFVKTKSILDSMGQTLLNTLKWNISSSLINRFTGSIQQAYGYVQHLDSSLNDIRIVTGKSADEMDRFAEKANKAAQALGKSTTEYTEAALIYYQQGLSDEETAARTETTLKAASVTGQSAKAVSEQLTAVWNGYRVTAEGTEEAVDKLAAVAATTAADLEELSTGMSKVASAANSMGVDMDQLNATIATIESVTRQAPESVGTALKTIYARMGDLKLGDTDEDGLKLGDVSSTLSKVGIEILDVNGELRDMGVIIEEIGDKWDTWTKAQQTAIAESVAGKRQYNNLFALFDNWDMYNEALETSRNSTGTLQKQQDIYMESTAAHIQKLKTEWEDLYDSLLDTKTINTFLNGLTKVLNLFTNFIDGIGGGGNVLLLFGSTFIKVFQKQIGTEIGNFILRIQQAKDITQQLTAQMQNIQLFKQSQGMQTTGVNELVNAYDKISTYYDILDEKGLEHANILAEQVAEAAILKEEFEDNAKAVNKYVQTNTGQSTFDIVSNRTKTGMGIGSDNTTGLNQTLPQDIEQLEKMGKAFQDVELYAESFADTFLNAKEKTNKGFKEWVQNLQNIENATESDDEAIMYFASLQEEINKVTTAFDKMSAGLKETVPGFKNIQEALNKIKQANSKASYDVAIKNLIRAFKEAGPEAKKFLQEMDHIKDQAPTIANSFDAAKYSLNQFLQTEAVKKFSQSITGVIGSIGQLASGILALKNIGNIFNNDDLTTGEKILQLISALGMSFTMIIGNLGNLSRSITDLGPSFAKLSEQFIANAAALEAENVGTIENIKARIAAGQAARAEAKAKREAAAANLAESLAVNAETGSEELNATASGRAAASKMTLTGAIWTHIKSLTAELIANIALHPVLAATTIAIAGITAAIVLSIKAHKDHLKAIKEENQAIIQASNERQQELDKNLDLISAYKDLINQYKEGSISVQEFNEKRGELIKTADLEQRVALRTAKTWEEASKALDDYAKKEYDKTIKNQQEKAKAGLQNALQEGEKAHGRYDETTRSLNYVSYSNPDDTVEGNEYLEALKKAGIITSEWDTDRGGYTIKFEISGDENGLKQIEELGKIQEEFQNSAWAQGSSGKYFFQNFQEIYDNIVNAEDYKDVEEAYNVANETLLNKAVVASAIDYADNIEDVKQAEFKFFEQLKESSLSEVEMYRAWNEALLNSNSIAAQRQGALQENAGAMIKDWMDNYAAQGGNPFQTDKWQKALNAAELLDSLGLSDAVGFIDQDTWMTLLMGNDDQAIINAAKEKMQNVLQAIDEEFRANVSDTSNSLSSIINKAISNELTGEDEEYQELASQLEKIKDIYPDLTDEIQTFNNEGLIGTEHWINSTYKLQDALDKIEYEELNKKVEEGMTKLDAAINGTTEYKQVEGGRMYAVEVEADDSKFQEAMDEIMDAEYAIDVEVHSDADRDFNRLVSSLDQADEMASKIGEDFVVAADDIRDLNNAFPGILEGIEYLGDGTIKLNEDVVQSAMAAASAEEEADTQKTLAKLQNSAKELRAKADVYDAMADIAATAAKTEGDTEQYKLEINKKANELQAENNKIKSNVEIDNAIAVTDNSQVNAKAMAENWSMAYQEAADASYQFATDAVANAAAAAEGPNGQPKKPDPGNYGVNYSGNAGKRASEATNATDQFEDEKGKIDWSAMEQSYREMAEAARANANDIEGMMVGAAAKATETMKNNLNAATGRPKEEKGGSDSGKDADHEEYLEHEEDIYRTINAELEQIESTLGRIQKINDHEWGIDAQKTLEEENKLLDEQLDKLEEKRALQEADLSIRRKQLEDIGVTFSGDGSAMTNAEAKLNQLYAQYNSMVDHYNNLSTDAQEVYKAELEAEKEKIDAIEKKMDEYESGFSDYQSTLDKILDTHYEAIANEVNQFNNMVEVHLELNEAEKEWNDFWKEVVEDVEDTDFAEQIAASMRQLKVLIGTRNDNNASTIKMLTNHLNETIGEVQAQIASANRGGEDSIFGDDTALSKETLTNYRDKLMDVVRQSKEEIDNISDNYLKLLNSAQDKIDEQIEGWNSIGDQIEHDVELIKLISGDKAFEALNKQYEKQYENDLKLIETQKMSQDYWKEQIDKYQKLVETTDKSSVEWKTYDKALQDSIKNYRKAVQDLDKTVQESIKDLQTWRENNVKAIEDTLDKAMSGGIGLDLAEKQWKLINDYADQYYDNVERAFNMEDYTNILNDAANAIGLSAENQDKLNQFREQELAQLNAKNKLTQYDIDESKARLEILKAEIALQDAQKNKSNMRLRRDSQGNYVYQYIGDEAEQEKAENGLLTARREWYELVKQRNKETNEYIIQLGKDRIDLQNQLAQAQLDGDQERINILLDLIKENEEQQVLAYEWAEDAKRDLMDGTATYFANVENNNILPMWDTTINEMVDKWANDDDSFIKASATAIKKLQEVQDKYVERTKEVLDKAGIEYTELKEQGVDPTRESLEELVETNEELEAELENINDLLSDQEGYLKDAEAAYNDLKDTAVDAIRAANQEIETLSQTVISSIQQVQAAIAAANSASNAMTSMANNYTNSNNSGNSNNSYSYTSKTRTSGKKNYTMQPDVGGTIAVYENGRKKEQLTPEALYRKYKPSDFGISNWNNSNIFNRGSSGYQWYDTGGYTGSWGKEGKLAVLHQKELVLNQDDTTNILKAVEAIRQVVASSNLGGNLLNASMTSSNMLSRISAGILQGVSNFDNSSSNTATSMVINADFSGVRSADEIYQALLELQNYGLQENYSVAPHINIGY